MKQKTRRVTDTELKDDDDSENSPNGVATEVGKGLFHETQKRN